MLGQNAATALGQNLSSFDKTFQNLPGDSDPTANTYLVPITGLVGTIGQMYLNHVRDVLLAKAIKDGAPQVEIIPNSLSFVWELFFFAGHYQKDFPIRS